MLLAFLKTLKIPMTNDIYLKRVVAGDHLAIDHLDMRLWVGELAVDLGAVALVALMLAAHLEREPARVLEARMVMRMNGAMKRCLLLLVLVLRRAGDDS